MLNVMGVKIFGIGFNLFVIEGVEYLSGCKYCVFLDMIEIGSWIGFVVMI